MFTPIYHLTTTANFRLVRDQAFKTMELFTKKLESYAATMVWVSFYRSNDNLLKSSTKPETAAPNPFDQFTDPVAATSQGTLVTSAAGAAGALAGWAMSSIGKRVSADYKADGDNHELTTLSLPPQTCKPQWLLPLELALIVLLLLPHQQKIVESET